MANKILLTDLLNKIVGLFSIESNMMILILLFITEKQALWILCA